MDYEFTHPEFLKLFYITPIFLLLAIKGIKKLALWRIGLSTLFRCIAFSMIVLALAGLSHVEKKSREVNIIYLVDVSDSIDVKGKEWMESYLKDLESKFDKKIKRKLNIFAINSKEILETESISIIDNINFKENFSEINPERTNIETAIISVLGKFPKESKKRIVLLTDGNENVGETLKSAVMARNENVEIFTVNPPKTIFENNITLKKVIIPSEIPVGKTAEIKIVVDNKSDSFVNGQVHLTVNHSDKTNLQMLLKKWDKNFSPGLNIFKTRYRAEEKGFLKFETSLQAENFNVEKSVISKPAIITGKSKILYVNGIKNRKLFLPETLEEREIEVNTISPNTIPDSIFDLLSYDSIIFSNVSKDMLKKETMEMIEQYVKDFGGGFVMLGGENSFIQGGYGGTLIEKILPVKMIGGEHKREKEKFRLSLVMVLDKSASMGGKKMTFAKKAAIALANQLKSNDKLGIIAFDNNPYVIAKLAPIEAVKTNLIAKLSRLYPSGGTNIFPALKLAYMSIINGGSKSNHVILLSDGNTEYLYYNKEALIKSFKKAKISISTIAIGKWFVNTNLLKAIASRTGGAFYKIEDVSELPKIIVKDVQYSLSQTDIHEEDFYPLKVTNSKILKDISQKQLPPLKGFSITEGKESAEIPLITKIRGKDDPILANWRYGLGKTVAYMADGEARWTSNWIKWEKYNKFWSQSLRWAMKDIPASDYSLKVKMIDNKPNLIIESFYKELNKNGNGKDDIKKEPVELKVRLYNTEKEEQASADANLPNKLKYDELLLRQIGPRSYITPLDSFEPGNYFTNVQFTQNDKVLSSKTKGLIIPKLKTNTPFDSGKHYNNIELLKNVATITGGKYLPEINDLTENLKKISKLISLVKYLIPIAFAALIFDIALRKL